MATIPAGLEIRGDRSPPGVTPARRGRGLFATRSYAPGEEIAVFGKPLIVLPSGPDATKTCNNCLDARRAGSIKKCQGCQAVVYCGKECQRAHWKRFHKFECKPLKNAFESAARQAAATPGGYVQPLPAPVRALMLVILQWKDSADIRATVEALEGNVPAFISNRDVWDDFKLQAAGACQFTGWLGEDQIRTAVEILCRIHTNTFDRRDHNLTQSGLFLDATLAMANHSCLPNAVVGFFGPKTWLRATEPIKAGDEITVSYIDYTKPRAARQRGLAHYNFTCTCRRCTENLDVYQVCQQSPVLSLNNRFTVVPRLDLLRNPPILREAEGHLITPEQIEAMYAESGVEAIDESDDSYTQADPYFGKRLPQMRRLYRICKPLIDAKRWADEPVAHLMHLAFMHFLEVRNFCHALAFLVFICQHIDPYRYPAPFDMRRVRNLNSVATMLPQVLKVVFSDGNGLDRWGRSDPALNVSPILRDKLNDLVDGATTEAVLRIVLEQGPKGHSNQWPPLDDARHFLRQVETMGNRELMGGMVKAQQTAAGAPPAISMNMPSNFRPDPGATTQAVQRWFADPMSPYGVRYFDERVLKRLNAVSAVAIELLESVLSSR
ncbi:set and mynd domain protein [Sporothrix brasiliensis 5110]|uniref:Set and mynd domain protein n=1 Tax=Sporothrix brasiliensis 5110 TaxID=1398154 RepID=A0A0C2IX24_9PEZI|nr:set and mynd domain protein [Sporothrix brasiliensis 5110]KIH89592.1 set and mynd domain protein [Sporothrix brasiliensis 5110]